MTDRNVQYPNRYKLEKVAGTDDIYDLTPAPGTVTEEGTLVNKSTLLKDVTAALYGLGTDAVPDDVLAKIKPQLDSNTSVANSKAQIRTGSYVGTGTETVTLPFSSNLIFIWWREDEFNHYEMDNVIFVKNSSPTIGSTFIKYTLGNESTNSYSFISTTSFDGKTIKSATFSKTSVTYSYMAII